MSVKLRQKKIAAGKISLYLDIYHNGQRQYDFLKLQLLKGTDSRIKAMNKETLELAETIRANRQTELQYSEYDFIPSFKRNADFVEYFKKLSENRGGPRPVWQNVLKHLKTYTGGKVAFKGVNAHWLEKWKDYLLNQVSRNSAHIYFTTTKASLNQAVKDGIIQSNPCRRVNNIGKADIERLFLTFDEIKKLSGTIPGTERAREVARMFLFGCFTGLSLANLETLTFEQIENDTVNFFRAKTKVWQSVPLSKTALRLLGVFPEKELSQFVFNIPKRQQSGNLLKMWGKQAGIRKNMHFHLSRHTFATLTLSSGGDLYTVSKLLGHKELATTQIYAKVIDETKRKAVNAIPQLEL